MNAAEVYLALVGKGSNAIEGDVVAKAYEKQIALYDWGWGLSLGQAEPGKQDTRSIESKQFTISKATDAASTSMMNLMHSGEVCDKATITMVQRMEQSIMLRLVLKKVRLMDFRLTLESDDSEVVMSEGWTLTFEEIEVMYKGARLKQDVRGSVTDSALRANTSFVLKLPPGTEFQPLPEKNETISLKDVEKLIAESKSRSTRGG